MYPPLDQQASTRRGVNADLWLLGIGFIEISAIAGAIEMIIGILRTRAPGMTLARMPIFAWAMLVFARDDRLRVPGGDLGHACCWSWSAPSTGPSSCAERGGDPLLWQHLFWFFGHPEVYIIFLPAAGMVSMIVPPRSRARRCSATAPGGDGAGRHGVPELRAVGPPHVHADRASRRSRSAVFSAASSRGGGADRACRCSRGSPPSRSADRALEHAHCCSCWASSSSSCWAG